MHMLERSLHVLLGASRYRRVAAVLREALDRAPGVESGARRRAAGELLAADPAPVPQTVEELKCELRTGRGA
jgi:hypothetical protein